MKEEVRIPEKWQVPFFAIWTGQTFSMAGSRLAQFALVWWLTQTTGSAVVLTTATLVAILPNVVLGPFAGALVDRWDRSKIMIVADGSIALVSAWLGYLFWSGSLNIWHVYVAMLARSLGESFHWPSMQASTSLMVPKAHLSQVAGLNQSMQGALGVVAPPLGAMLLSVLPLHGIMGIDVVTAFIAITPLFFVAIPQPRQSVLLGKGAARPSVWSDFRAGLRYAWGWPSLMAVLALAMIINFVINPAFSLMPLLVTDHFRGGALQLGGLESAWGVGMLLGGILLSVWGGTRRRVYTSLSGLIIAGVSVAAIGLTPADAFPMALAAMFLAGLMNPLINGPLFAILQATVAPEMQGRVFTLTSSLSTAMMPLSLAIAGPVAEAAGVQPWYLFGGLVFSLCGVAGFFIPAVVHIEEMGAPPPETVPAPAPAEVLVSEEPPL
jgi:DHA3 family macrolide efflux protein-like MFS transporter